MMERKTEEETIRIESFQNNRMKKTDAGNSTKR